VKAALYLTDQGCYLLKAKTGNDGKDGVIVKNLREADVCAAFTHSTKDSGWLPSGILRVGNTVSGPWFVYFAQRQTVKITLAQRGEFLIPLPATILFGYSGHYHLFALADKEISPSCLVYHAPFPNTDDKGEICWGSNPKPKVDSDKAPSIWKLFFDSPFNDHYADGKSKTYRKDVRTLLEKTVGAAEFPVEELVSMNINIGKMINQLVRGDL
jgi:PRTRC genetic system protein B